MYVVPFVLSNFHFQLNTNPFPPLILGSICNTGQSIVSNSNSQHAAGYNWQGWYPVREQVQFGDTHNARNCAGFYTQLSKNLLYFKQ